MVHVVPVRSVRSNVRGESAHGRCRPVDAKNAPTRTWKTAQNAVSHSAHTHHHFETKIEELKSSTTPHTRKS
jgi:hypothetical protein